MEPRYNYNARNHELAIKEVNGIDAQFASDQNTGKYVRNLRQLTDTLLHTIKLLEYSNDLKEEHIADMSKRLTKLEREMKEWKSQW